MSQNLIFNHCSLPFLSQADAEKGFTTFLETLNQIRRFGLKVLLVDHSQDKSLMRVELCSGYFVADWFSKALKKDSMRDLTRFFKSLETR